MPDRPIAIAPCCLRSHRYRLGLTFRRLELLGANDDDDGVASEYIGLIVAPGYEEAAASFFIDAVAAGKFGQWDECVLDMMHGECPTLPHLAARAMDHGFPAQLTKDMDAPYVTLPTSWETYTAALSKKHRQSIKYSLRDFEAWVGERGYHLHRATSLEELQQGVEILGRLHEERWLAEGHSGAFSSPRFDAFHSETAPKFFADGRASVMWLTVGDEPVAAHYHFLLNGRLYFYQSGRRMNAPPTVRLGIVMIALVIQDAIARGLTEFDCLGGAAQYKSTFTKSSHPLMSLRFARPSWRENLRTRLIRIRDQVRHGATRTPDALQSLLGRR